ncbi:hydroxyacid dehydrogenase [Bordetella petrii]|uniref:D-3-phosphoglycerate dehydrogenase n=1 Tax=Bordetella petrii (strain ATCC BAA-461 / DSM 12804 / CCUG 43448 / CIP 107267 / Se-1111R) TaxID=340100 RepID=A9I3E4_BORPD|nr:hydroxyacid dehydrogenase [Bordetella petrii]CAP44162.1 D-3-phosphoglycerate dehydrogenase [Bordetella petrii]
MTRIFLTHNRAALRHYYGEPAYRMLAGMAQVAFHDSDSEPTQDDIVRQARDCDILVSFRIPPIDARLLAALPRLAAVCRVAVDIRNIDVDYASRHGILVMRATPGFGASVAEWVVGAMVMLARHMGPATCAYQNGQRPVPLMGTELRAATLGIIGYGTIGRYLAGLARAFGMRLVINDPHVRVDTEPGVTQATLDELLAQSDFVVCLAPAIAETARLINLPAFRKMKPSAYFINASRAELVDEDDLLQALDAGLIAGCALDVGSAQDQMPPARLAAHPRVVATPHIGGLTPQASEHQAMDSVRQVRALLEGRMPECSVNAAHATRARDRFGLRLPAQ